MNVFYTAWGHARLVKEALVRRCERRPGDGNSHRVHRQGTDRGDDRRLHNHSGHSRAPVFGVRMLLLFLLFYIFIAMRPPVQEQHNGQLLSAMVLRGSLPDVAAGQKKEAANTTPSTFALRELLSMRGVPTH